LLGGRKEGARPRPRYFGRRQFIACPQRHSVFAFLRPFLSPRSASTENWLFKHRALSRALFPVLRGVGKWLLARGEHKSDEKVGREVASGDPPSPSAFAEATEGQEATAGPSSLRSLGMTTFRKRRRRGPSRSGGQASLGSLGMATLGKWRGEKSGEL
jgi:hypothetical protein